MIGTTIGKYRIIGLLGRGATGIVYRAVDGTLDREVAIKVLNPQFAAADIMKRFRAEATILARLSHPEIAIIHELLRTDTDLLMVMELVRGETLENLSTRVGPMSPDLAAHLLDGILSALEHAHRAGIVHRDLKPANVMVTQLGGIKIMDFGIARVRGAEHLTIDGFAVGTPAYMPPEQVLGEEIDGRADLYAVGVILYRLLTGKLPFEAETPMAMLQKQVAETPSPLRLHREGLPDWCELVVQRALAKAPADRFQSAEEFRLVVGRATGLAPSVDLAKAFAITASDAVAAEWRSPAAETIADPALEAKPSFDPTAGGTVQLPAPVPTAFMRAKRVAGTRRGIAVLGGTAAVLGIAAYLAGNPLAVDSGSRTNSVTSDGARSTSDDPRAVVDPASRPSPQSSRRTAPTSVGRSEPATTSASSPLVFRTKIVRAPGREGQEEDARLSLGGTRLTVTSHRFPDEPVFSAQYSDITAIQHSREAAWKPPRKLAKVIRVEDDVLDALGIRDRHYVSLYTAIEHEGLVLRVDERSVNRLLKELKQRTGRDPQRTSGR